jgi:hypothetical protein
MDVGFNLKQEQTGVYTLRAKRYCTLTDGTVMEPPQVVDADGNPWPESRGLIGNGSRCNVKIRAKYQTYNGVETLSCYFEGLQVLDLVPYSGGVQFKPAEGNTAGWGQQNFTPQQQQQPPAPQQYQQYQQPPAQPQQYQQPQPQPTPQQTAPDPYSQVPREAQPQQGFNPAQISQGAVPQGVPTEGNVSQLPSQGGALGLPHEQAVQPGVQAHNTGDDVPF